MTAEELISSMGWAYENTEMSARLVAEHAAKIISELEEKVASSFSMESWDSADKITHDGFVYVKFNDLK